MNSPIILECCRRNDAETLKGILENEEISNLINENMILHEATTHNSKDCLQVLLDHGADPNVKNKKGLTPLHIAALHNSLECIKILVKAGANVNEELVENGYSPLHCVARAGSKECAEFLINAGADIRKSNKHDVTPMHVAFSYNQKEIVRLLVHYGGFDLLKAKNTLNQTPRESINPWGTHEREWTRFMKELSTLDAKESSC